MQFDCFVTAHSCDGANWATGGELLCYGNEPSGHRACASGHLATANHRVGVSLLDSGHQNDISGPEFTENFENNKLIKKFKFIVDKYIMVLYTSHCCC